MSICSIPKLAGALLTLILIVTGQSLLVSGDLAAQTTPLTRAYILGADGKARAPYYAIFQANLKILDYYTGSVDNDAGAQTIAAIKRFQKDQGLPTSGTLNAATTRAAKTRVKAYYKAQLGLDFNGDWAPKGRCSSGERFRIQQSAWFKPTGSRLKLPTLNFAEVRSGMVKPRLGKRLPELRAEGGRLFELVVAPPTPLEKPEPPEEPKQLTEAEYEALEENPPEIALETRALADKPGFTAAAAAREARTERRYYQRCS